MKESGDDDAYYLKGPSEFIAPVEKELKTVDQLEHEWGDSNDNRSCKKYIYDYMQEENARLRSLIETYNEGIKKYVFHHDKFFQSPKVGQPPSLQPLRELIKDYDANWEQFKKDNNL